MATQKDARRAIFLHGVGGLADAYGRAQFKFRRQGDPQLKATRAARFVKPAAMPHAASSLHPFDAARRQCAPGVVRVDIAHRADINVTEQRLIASLRCGIRRGCMGQLPERNRR